MSEVADWKELTNNRSVLRKFLAFTFVIASGIAILEVAANSYISVLGPPKHAAFRLVLAQAFNVSVILLDVRLAIL